MTYVLPIYTSADRLGLVLMASPHTLKQLVIGHGWTKGGMGVWPRDFALLLGKRALTAEEGGGYVLYGHSIQGVIDEDSSKFVSLLLFANRRNGPTYSCTQVRSRYSSHERFRRAPAGG